MKTTKFQSLKLLCPMALLLLSGCAQIVTKNYSPSRGGVVKYNTGWFMDEKNRAKAQDEMTTFCAPGRAKILKEDSMLESTGKVYTSGSAQNQSFSSTSTEGKENNVYIHFKCVKGSKVSRR